MFGDVVRARSPLLLRHLLERGMNTEYYVL